MGYFDHEGTYWPENRLIDRLHEIKQLNQEFGSRAAGGGGVPMDVLLEHKGATVIDPLDPEVAAEREAAWNAELAAKESGQSSSATRVQPVGLDMDVMHGALLKAVDNASTAPMQILGITLTPPLITTNKGLFPITPAEAASFKRNALALVIASLTKAMEEDSAPTGTDTP